ncbi:MAG: glucose-1-phosphate cytidylyltransferase [Treponema sp.]|jgi:glucose-1-phosphate cytidylyltransferase|nr:glucose-1-phosphate cytidylyltransferase [Treponema sp.]
MKVVILAGGLGTRLSEETELKPKPMVEIGGRPILWHIMKIYSYWGFNDFVILTGYKSHIIKDYFINYYTRYSDITIDMVQNTVEIHNHRTEPWRVTMLYTGQNTMTGGRLLGARQFLGNERFMLTYGDGVSDVNIPEVLKLHEKLKKIATVTSIQPAGKYGSVNIDAEGNIVSFHEKPLNGGAWINGGFFIMESGIFSYLRNGDATVLEQEPFQQLAKDNQLAAYKHPGFWHSMDTLREKNELTNLWTKGKAPWALWLK